MFFINEKGELLEGSPLSGSDKETYDKLKELFHEKVCGGYDSYGTHKCSDLAIYFVQHFNITPKQGIPGDTPEEPKD